MKKTGFDARLKAFGKKAASKAPKLKKGGEGYATPIPFQKTYAYNQDKPHPTPQKLDTVKGKARVKRK